ncbi:MAG: HAD hydrolase-like protein [Bacteroidia bacterium]|nr:HAD hydrolase-like protein [Bacteroidia bacterium]
MFDRALQQVNAHREECILIGDDLEADIRGAKNAQWDHIFYNPAGYVHQEIIHLEINCLSKLFNHF